MKLFKILILNEDGDLISPFQRHNYGKLEDVLGKKLVCEDFDEDPAQGCSNGFYATTVDGLIYTNLSRKGSVVLECEMEGREVYYSQYKRRFEGQTFLRVVPVEEIKNAVKEYSNSIDWNYYEALFPVNPLDIHNDLSDIDVENLIKWDSVWDSVRDSVRDSVWDSVRDSVRDSVWDSVWDSVRDSVRDSVWDSVWDSVRDSVRDSVWDSVGAYISSLFPNIKKWEYIEHEEGVNPFQCGIDLSHRGFVPVKVDNKWSLWSAKTKSIVYTLEN